MRITPFEVIAVKLPYKLSWKIVIAALLVLILPVFIWAVATQRIELRKRAATSEPPTQCWNRVIERRNTTTNAVTYYWPNSCRGTIVQPGQVCGQSIVGLTATEIYNFLRWVRAGKPYIPGCQPRPECGACTGNADCASGLVCQVLPTPTPNCPNGPNGPCSIQIGTARQICMNPNDLLGSLRRCTQPGCVTPGQMCGGIRGVACPSGTRCVYPDGGIRATYPDQSGTCQPLSGVTICPTPSPVSCSPNGSLCNTSYCPQPSCGAGQLCPQVMCADRPGVCVNGRCVSCVPRTCDSSNPLADCQERPLPVGQSYCPWVTPTPTSLQIISPNGGEQFVSGQGMKILWKATAPISAYTISLISLDGTVREIGKVNGSQTGYAWTVGLPATVPTGLFKIRITGTYAYPTGFHPEIAYRPFTDESDNYFVIINTTCATNGAKCALSVCPTPSCPPGAYCAMDKMIALCRAQTGICRNGRCVLPLTPTPTNTPRPTATPTPGPSVPQKITFQVMLAGVTNDSAKGATMSAEFHFANGTIRKIAQDIVLQPSGTAGVYTASITLKNGIAKNSKFNVKIKGEKHVSVRFCKFSGQTDPCGEGTYMQFTDAAGTPITFNFTKLPLPPGDLNHDGRVNADDISIIRSRLARLDLTAADYKLADVDYSGSINQFDMNLVLQTLSIRYDQ